MRAFLILLLGTIFGMGATLEWDPNPEESVIGYRVYHGFASGYYTDVRDAGNWTQIEVEPVPCAVSHWFAVTAYTADGRESDFSEELEWVPKCPQPSAPGGLRISSRTNFVTLEWSQDLIYWEALGSFPLSNSNGFFRALK